MIQIDISVLKRGKINMIQFPDPMPRNCAECLFLQHGSCIFHDGDHSHMNSIEKRPDWCPLMEVPDDLH